MNIEGKIIEGKWNKNQYKVESIIGKGGVGEVYKVYDIKKKNYYALKISKSLHSITKEANMLEKFKALDGIPKVVETDDYSIEGEYYYFIVLEYIRGENLKEYIKNNKLTIKEKLGIVIVISEIIKKIHSYGLIFGDLKLENIMIDKVNNKIKIIDLGGVVPMGASIKEFTPAYDRARWNMGLRRADVGYDLFSICMLLVNLLLNIDSRIGDKDVYNLINELESKKIDKGLLSLIKKGLLQKKITFNYFLENLKNIYKIIQLNKKIIYNDKVTLLINTFFLGSIFCFFALLAFVIVKG